MLLVTIRQVSNVATSIKFQRHRVYLIDLPVEYRTFHEEVKMPEKVGEQNMSYSEETNRVGHDNTLIGQHTEIKILLRQSTQHHRWYRLSVRPPGKHRTSPEED